MNAHADWRTRLALPACLGALLLLAGGCGTGGESGVTLGQIVGGSTFPDREAYAATLRSETVTEGSDALPSHVDLRRDRLVPPVQNQRWNSCVAWALGYYVMTAVEAKRARETDPRLWIDVNDPANWFSPHYIYSQRDTDEAFRLRRAPGDPVCRELDRDLGCMRPERALSILVTQGCCKWDWMCRRPITTKPETPYNHAQVADAFRTCASSDPDIDISTIRSRRNWVPAMDAAEPFKARCYVRFGSLTDGGLDTRRAMKRWLHEQGTPIAIVVRMTSGWVTYREESPVEVLVKSPLPCDRFESRGVLLDAGGTDLSSQHMMTVIGYDDAWPTSEHVPDLPEEKRGSFLIVNQWGTKWGHEGLMWIPYTELERIWIGGYGVLPGSSAGDTLIEQCARDEQGKYIELVEPDDVPINLTESGDRDLDAVQALVPGSPPTRDVVGGHRNKDGAPLSGRDVADWWTFETDAPRTPITLVLTGPDDGALAGNLRPELFDDELRLIEASDEPGTERIERTLCRQGTYFVKVEPVGADDQSFYEIGLTTAAPDPTSTEICDADEFVLDGLALLRGTVGGGEARDWWTFTAPETEVLQIGLVLAVGTDMEFEVRRGSTPDTAQHVRSETILGSASAFELPVVAGEELYLRIETADPQAAATFYEVSVRSCPRLIVPPAPTLGHLEEVTMRGHVTGFGVPPGPCQGPVSQTFTIVGPPSGQRIFTMEISGVAEGSSFFLSTQGLLNSPTLRDVGTTSGCIPLGSSSRSFEITVSAGNGADTDFDLRVQARLDDTEFDDGDRPRFNERRLTLSNPFWPSVASELLSRPGDTEDYHLVSGGVLGTPAILELTGYCVDLDVNLSNATVDDPSVFVSDAGSTPTTRIKRLALPSDLEPLQTWARVHFGPNVTDPAAETVYTIRLFGMPEETPGDGNEMPGMADELSANDPTGPRAGSLGFLPDGADLSDYFRVPIEGEPDTDVGVRVAFSSTDDNPLGMSVWSADGVLHTPDASGVAAFDAQAGTEILVLLAYTHTSGSVDYELSVTTD